ncbi:M1 family metallopeptidase [soil metagenome]
MNLARRTNTTWHRKRGAQAVALALAAGGLVALQTTTAQAVTAIDGAQTSGDTMFPHVGNGGYDAKHYDVKLAWTPGATLETSTVKAKSTMKAKALVPLKTFSMDFEGLKISSVKVNGTPAKWSRDIDADAIKYKLVITPAKRVVGSFTTVVKYSGIPTSHTDADGSSEGWNVTADGATFLGQPIGSMTAFPNNNTPSDKATYTFKINIPTKITNSAGTGAAAVASNGELLSKKKTASGTRRTWVWKQKKQMASELALISIGKYDVLKSKVRLRSGRVVPEWSFVDSALSADEKNVINERRGDIGKILRGLESIYGRYPGNSTGVVVDTVPSGINYALETQDRSFFPSSRAVAGDTLTHELAHQWYGDAVSPTVWTDIWINEGQAEWAPVHYNNVIAKTSDETTEDVFFAAWEGVPADDEAWTIPPAAQTDSANLYGFQTYDRSAQMWEALKITIGDRDFFTFLKQWQHRYNGTSRGGKAFIALAEKVSKEDLGPFFQDWIYDADKPAWPSGPS